jgi:hypothetical protein
MMIPPNNNPLVEAGAAAVGITDALHNDRDADYLIKAVRALAVARKLSRFDAAGFGNRLFDFFTQSTVRNELRELCGRGRQYCLVTAEQSTSTDALDELGMRIPPEIIGNLKTLGLCFKIEARRPSLASMWEDIPPGAPHH